MQKGPIAPKDPVEKKPFFYIMLDKEIYASKQTDGRGIQFIYQNDNRLVNSAKIVGNITNNQMLEMLKTTKGFRQLVYAIGVSVSEASMEKKLRFVYQMYGNMDTYGSGTNIMKEMVGNGVEELIYLEDIEWSEDDKEPGQIRFEFEQEGVQAQASIRLYLRDGFEAPPVVMDEAIEEDSQAYQEMIERSLLDAGNMKRLYSVIQKARAGEDVTLAYIGGSITQGAGAIPIHEKCYAYQSYQAFAKMYGKKDNVHFVKAGVGGTPSELGMIRFQRDVLRDGKANPDIVVVEFAVNDEGDETKGVCYESLVRRILALPNKPAVVLLFAVFAYDWNLQDRLEVVGKQYQLPMISIKDAVSPQFGLTKEQGRVLSKNQFFYDIYHPSNMGHKIMSDCLVNLWRLAGKEPNVEDITEVLLRNKPAIGNRYEMVRLLDRKEAYEKAYIVEGSFSQMDEQLQAVEMDDRLVQIPQFPYNWHREGASDNQNDCFEMTITCSSLLMIYKDSGANDFGKAHVFVDGEMVLTADPHRNGWVHCNPVILFEKDIAEEHVVKICMAEEDRDKKFTILGFGYVE